MMKSVLLLIAVLVAGCSMVHTPRNYYLIMDN